MTDADAAIYRRLEDHFIPAGGADHARQEVLLGVRGGPLALMMLLIPGMGDP